MWTIGHSNHSIAKFIELLEIAGLKHVVDVRSRPFSKFTPHFNHSKLESALKELGISYTAMGESLGGRPSEPSMYDLEGYVLYGEMAKSIRLQTGISHLLEIASRQRTVVMCSEESPVDCHRRLLITRLLAGKAEVIHLRGDGSSISENELKSTLELSTQPPLFTLEEVEQWKSIRPVLQNMGQEPFSN